MSAARTRTLRNVNHPWDSSAICNPCAAFWFTLYGDSNLQSSSTRSVSVSLAQPHSIRSCGPWMLRELTLIPGIQAGRKTLIERDFGKTGTSIRCRRILPYSNIEAEFSRSRYINIGCPVSLFPKVYTYSAWSGISTNLDCMYITTDRYIR